MSLVINERTGSPWTAAFVFQGQVLAQFSSGSRAEQEGAHQERESDPETFGPEERIEVEKESDDNGSSEDGYTDDVECEDDYEDEDYEDEDYEDADYEGEDDEEEEDDGDEVDEEEVDDDEGTRDLLNSGEEPEASSLAIVVPSQTIEVTGFTIDEEACRTFHAKPIEEQVTTLAGLAFAVTGYLAMIGFILWGMAHAFENIVVAVEWS